MSQPETSPRGAVPLRGAAAFIAVGGVAAAVHLGVVSVLVGAAAWAPLWANPLGWLVAFCFSFGGHRAFSFKEQAAPLGRSAWRFFSVSAAGFAVNESAYAVLLRQGSLGYQWALALVLVAVAVLTYVVSRYWAFVGAASAPPRA
jgi:putative flippase GtrA